MFHLSDEEQELFTSVFPEIQEILMKSNENQISFTISHPTLGGNFKLTFEASHKQKQDQQREGAPVRIIVKVSHFDEEKIDVAVSANFEVFVKKQWLKLVNGSDEKEEETQLLLPSIMPTKENFIDVLMSFIPIIMNEFDPDATKASSSSSWRNSQQSKSFDRNQSKEGNNSDDDDDNDDEEDQIAINDTEDLEAFFRKQHELKLQRALIKKREEDEDKSGTSTNINNNKRGPFRTTDEKYVVLIHEYHHIYCTPKQKFMVEKAIDFDLQGIMLRGKPGRCIIEGTFEGVTNWSRLVKGLRWQRCTEIGIFETLKETDGKAPWIFDSGFGYRKCEAESELKRILMEETTTPSAVKFFTYAFPKCL